MKMRGPMPVDRARNTGQPGLAIVISGPSGSGKSTICKRLLKRGDYVMSVSATTRPKRPDEREGVDYVFVSRDSFLKTVAAGGFLEYSEHFGNLYGTPAQTVWNALQEGRTILLEIDVNGARQLLEKIPGAFSIFVVAPDRSEIERRLRNRGSDSEDSIHNRLSRADMEIAKQAELRYHRQVINDNLDKAVEEIHSLIQNAEAQKTDEG